MPAWRAGQKQISAPKTKKLWGAVQQSRRTASGVVTYQNCGKLSLSSSHQRSSSHSLSRSLGFLPSFWTAWGVVLLVTGAGREVLYLTDGSEVPLAFLTSVMDVLAEP